jgi:hypothetical protein
MVRRRRAALKRFPLDAPFGLAGSSKTRVSNEGEGQMEMDPTKWMSELMGMIDEKKMLLHNAQWAAMVLKAARASLELHRRGVETFQHQMARLVELSLSKTPVAKEQLESIVKEWTGTIEKARNGYFEMLEQGLKTMEARLAKEQEKKDAGGPA